MNTFAYQEPDDREMEQPLPGRPRRRLQNRGTASLMALLLGAVGFLVGIKVEKTHQSESSTSAVSSPGSTNGDRTSVAEGPGQEPTRRQVAPLVNHQHRQQYQSHSCGPGLLSGERLVRPRSLP